MATQQGTRPGYQQDDDGTVGDTIKAIQIAFAQMGLTGLEDLIQRYYREGVVDSDSMLFRLRDTDIYKKRFAANEARRKKGLSELTPAAYIALEDKYRDLMKQASLPPGFYDSTEDFSNLIANDLSPAEVQTRVTWAKEAAYSADPAFKTSLREMYGVNDADVVAYFLDPDKATALLERRYNATQFNASAKRAGIEFGTGFSEEVGLLGAGRADLDQRMGAVAAQAPAAERLSEVYGEDLTAEDLTRQALNLDGSAAAAKKAKRLASRERAAFGGSAAAAGLGVRQQA